MTKISDYMSIGDAAKIVGIPPHTLRRWTKSGKVAACKNNITGHYLYRYEDVVKVALSVLGKDL